MRAGFARRALAVVVAIPLVLAACSGDRPTVSTSNSAAPITEGSGEAPKAVVSSTGIVLPVLSSDGSSYVVSTPCGRDAELAWGQPLRDITVVLDPGHGGVSEPGAKSGELTESAINLLVAQRTAALLEAEGVSVAMTRTSDYRIPITSRVAIIEALAPQAYISIHHNSSPVEPSDSPGSEVYAQSGSDESRRLAGLIYKKVFDSLSGFDAVKWISAREPGVITVLDEDGQDAYGIVRGPSSPGVLAELAYLSNPSEAEFIATEEYQDVVSAALAGSILDFISNSNARGGGFVDKPREFRVDNSTGGSQDCQDPDLGL